MFITSIDTGKPHSVSAMQKKNQISFSINLKTKILTVLSLLIFTATLNASISAQNKNHSLFSSVGSNFSIFEITDAKNKTFVDSFTSNAINFETFAAGTSHNQSGWSSSGSIGAGGPGFDHAIVNNTSAPAAFGTKSLRISNAVTSGSFGDQTYSASLPNEAGETSAVNGGISGGTRQNKYFAEWQFVSADPSGEQVGLSVVASPDRGDGARMSWIQMTDTPAGINVNFNDYQRGLGNTCASGLNFVQTAIASGLDRATPHTIRIEMDFVDGIANDVVRVYIDGILRHTGTSWEDYFRDCEGNPTRTVDSILFRTAGTAAPANIGKGFLIDNLLTGSSTPATSVIKASNAQGWFFFNEGATGSGSYVTGPTTAPLGNGSARMTVDATGRQSFGTLTYAGTRLDQITQLNYSTYQNNNSNLAATISLQFGMDYNLTDGDTSFQGRLVYEPYQSATVQQNVWQTWSPLGGRFWATRAPFNAVCPQENPCTWAQVLANYPNAGIHTNTAGGLGIVILRAGGPIAGGFDGNVDNFTIGVNSSSTTFDFEPTATIVVDADGQASATDCNASDLASTTIQNGVNAASPGDIVRVCSGNYNLSSTIALTKPGLTILGVGATRPVVQIPTSTGYGFTVGAPNVTLDNLEIQKTDLGTQHNMILIQGSNFTAQNNLIYGPNPGSEWSVNGLVSRAFEATAGLTGLLFQNNTIHTLRQPAYINASSGSALNNNVSGTRGWVIDGGNITFNGNTFGEPQNQGCDIALLASTSPANYPNLLALSQSNDNGFICAQFAGGANGRARAFVDSTPSAGNGSDNSNYTTITEGINGALPGGTVQVAEGTYIEQLNINKPLTVIGPNATVNPNTGARVPEAIILTPTSDPTSSGVDQVIIAAENVTFNGFTVDGDNPALASGVVFNGSDVNSGYGIVGSGTANPRATITNNIVKNIGEFGIFLYGSNAGGAANSTIQNNKLDNIPGQVFGQAIHIRDNAYANVTGNVVSRSGFGVVIENFSNNGAAAASISNNQISANIYGIRHNLHYNYTSPGFTISNNTITSYIESFVRAAPPTRFNGIRVESINGTVPVTVSGNTITPNRAALVGNGYTRVDGIYITNTSTVSPNISITGNTISNALRGISHTTPAVPSITCNLITGNDTGIYIGTDIQFGGTTSSSTNGVNISQNNIVGNSAFGVQNDTGIVSNAENNYWGAANGPGPSGSGNNVSANVDFTPFLTSAATCATQPPPTVSISGNISPSLANVTVTLSGTQSATTLTDASGNYSFTNLPNDGNYLVTPSLAGYTFEPTNRNYTNLTTSVTNANFAGLTGGSPRLIRVVSQNVTPGNSAIVPVEMVSQGNENTVGFSFNYNSSVIFNPVVALGADAAGASLVVNNTTAGQLGIIIALPSGQTFNAGTRQIATVTFSTSNNPPFSTPVSFSDSPILRQVANANADVLPASYSSGVVTFAQGFESDVAPRNNGSGTGLITAQDYTQTGLFVAGLEAVNPAFNEFQRADAAPRATKGDGLLSASDYTQAGRYAAGLDAVQTAGGPIVSNLFDFLNPRGKKDEEANLLLPRILRVVDVSTSAGQQVLVRIEIDAEGDENAFGFTINYDQAILSNPLVALGADLPTGTLIPNTITHPGKVGVIAAAPIGQAIPAGTRHIVTIRFDVAPNAPTGDTSINMVGHPPVVNEVSSVDAQVLPTTFTGGIVTILSPTAANVSVGGKVSSAFGEAIPNARMILTDTTGATISAVSNSFGNYRFDGVRVGETYTLTTTARGFTFAPQVVSATSDISEMNIIAEQ